MDNIGFIIHISSNVDFNKSKLCARKGKKIKKIYVVKKKRYSTCN